MKYLSELIGLLDPLSVYGPTNHMQVDSVTERSSVCRDYSIFVACPGQLTDGHEYIEDAISRGAKAVICQRLPERLRPDVAYLVCEQSQIALSVASNWLYGPYDGMTLIAVTGTDGKSTACYALYQLLRTFAQRVALRSTVYVDDGSGLVPTDDRMTTPSAPGIHSFLARARDNGCTICIIEASSHGLSHRTGRLYSLHFDCSIITTITSEHLDFHKTRERYIDDKLNCVRQLTSSGILVTTDELDLDLRAVLREDVNHERCSLSDKRCSHYLDPDTISLPRFFASDLLLAATAISSLRIASFEEATRVLGSIRLPEGRFSVLDKTSSQLIIDYAHTPAAVKALLEDCRKSYPGKELVVLIGAAGRRDRSKREELGRILSAADRLYLTDEDPRDELPMKIIDDIAGGILPDSPVKIHRIPDRQRAIDTAVSNLEENSLLLLLGKGHERSIEYDGYSIYWDEQQAVESALSLKGIGPVMILYGGRSVEHEVSCRSAARVASDLVACGVPVRTIAIDHQGTWYDQGPFTGKESILRIETGESRKVLLAPGQGLINQGSLLEVGIILPVTHGTGGEDGTLQGILESLGLPYVGSDTISSAICMDKLLTKRLVQTASIPVLSATSLSYEEFSDRGLFVSMDYPLFIKPRRGGSSVGSGRARDEREAVTQAELAFRYDQDIIIEPAIDALEIECGLFQGPQELFVTLPGSVRAEGEFYDYESKYTAGRQHVEIPALIDQDRLELIRDYSRRVFGLLGCSGFARIDFFLDRKSDRLYLNEVNTIPGMSPTSLFPLLVTSSGYSTSFFYHQILSAALSRFNSSRRVERRFQGS